MSWRTREYTSRNLGNSLFTDFLLLSIKLFSNEPTCSLHSKYYYTITASSFLFLLLSSPPFLLCPVYLLGIQWRISSLASSLLLSIASFTSSYPLLLLACCVTAGYPCLILSGTSAGLHCIISRTVSMHARTHTHTHTYPHTHTHSPMHTHTQTHAHTHTVKCTCMIIEMCFFQVCSCWEDWCQPWDSSHGHWTSWEFSLLSTGCWTCKDFHIILAVCLLSCLIDGKKNQFPQEEFEPMTFEKLDLGSTSRETKVQLAKAHETISGAASPFWEVVSPEDW